MSVYSVTGKQREREMDGVQWKYHREASKPVFYEKNETFEHLMLDSFSEHKKLKRADVVLELKRSVINQLAD